MLPIKVLILDDDINAYEILKFNIESKFDNLFLEYRKEPDVSGNFDIYILDNDFKGKQEIESMVKKIRNNKVNALIIAFSATLNQSILKNLLNHGCDAVAEKTMPSDMEMTMKVIEKYCDMKKESGKPCFIKTINALSELLRQWNHRMNLTK